MLPIHRPLLALPVLIGPLLAVLLLAGGGVLSGCKGGKAAAREAANDSLASQAQPMDAKAPVPPPDPENAPPQGFSGQWLLTDARLEASPQASPTDAPKTMKRYIPMLGKLVLNFRPDGIMEHNAAQLGEGISLGSTVFFLTEPNCRYNFQTGTLVLYMPDETQTGGKDQTAPPTVVPESPGAAIYFFDLAFHTAQELQLQYSNMEGTFIFSFKRK